MCGRARIFVVPLIVALVACGTEPSGLPISGQWGASEVEFIATSRSVTLRLPCQAQVRFAGPLHPDGSGRFQLAGAVVQRFGGSHVRVTGVVNGAELNLTLEFTYDGGGRRTQRSVLHAGVRPDFSQSVCFA